MDVSFSLTGQVALVTGASRGIGHDLVLALAAAGAHVVAAARHREDVDTLLARVAAEGGSASAVALDVTAQASIDAAVTEVEAAHGRIDVLVNNAGLGFNHDALEATKVLALEWAPHGVTVNTVAPTYAYTPGTAERLDDPAVAADVLGRIPTGRFATTADIAAAVIYLASPAAGMVTGTVLPVDGGWTAQ